MSINICQQKQCGSSQNEMDTINANEYERTNETNDIGSLFYLDGCLETETELLPEIKRKIDDLLHVYEYVVLNDHLGEDALFLRSYLGESEYTYGMRQTDASCLQFTIGRQANCIKPSFLSNWDFAGRQSRDFYLPCDGPDSSFNCLLDLFCMPAEQAQKITHIDFAHHICFVDKEASGATYDPTVFDKFLVHFPNLKMVWTSAYDCTFNGEFRQRGIMEVYSY